MSWKFACKNRSVELFIWFRVSLTPDIRCPGGLLVKNRSVVPRKCGSGIVSSGSWVSQTPDIIVQELCESCGGRPGLSVLTSLLASVDVKIFLTVLRHWSQLVPNKSADIRGH